MRAKVLISRGKERVQHHSLNFHQQISNSKVKVRVSMRKQKWESKSESEGWKCNLISRGKQRVQQQQPQKFLFCWRLFKHAQYGKYCWTPYLPKPIKIMLSRQFPTHQSLMVKPLKSAIRPLASSSNDKGWHIKFGPPSVTSIFMSISVFDYICHNKK